jgi:excisionase family DNA binding protein
MNSKGVQVGTPTGRRLLGIKEASLYIGLQVDTIYRMVSQRRIPFIKVGRRTMFDVRLLDDWLAKHTVMPTPPKVA